MIDAKTPNTELLKLMDRVERGMSWESYQKVVMGSLYRDARDERSLITQPLLSVLGAMTMKSKRGCVREVLTFNFDDLLERYIRIHGFAGEIICRLPCLRRDVDLTVYHPHGFVPSPGSRFEGSDFLIFSKYSFDERLGEQLDPWTELSRDLLLRKVALFIGLSAEGPNLGPLLINVAKRLREPRPTGIWLVGPDDAPDTEEQLIKWNVAPIRLATTMITRGSCWESAKRLRRCFDIDLRVGLASSGTHSSGQRGPPRSVLLRSAGDLQGACRGRN